MLIQEESFTDSNLFKVSTIKSSTTLAVKIFSRKVNLILLSSVEIIDNTQHTVHPKPRYEWEVLHAIVFLLLLYDLHLRTRHWWALWTLYFSLLACKVLLISASNYFMIEVKIWLTNCCEHKYIGSAHSKILIKIWL